MIRRALLALARHLAEFAAPLPPPDPPPPVSDMSDTERSELASALDARLELLRLTTRVRSRDL